MTTFQEFKEQAVQWAEESELSPVTNDEYDFVQLTLPDNTPVSIWRSILEEPEPDVPTYLEVRFGDGVEGYKSVSGINLSVDELITTINSYVNQEDTE